MENYARKLIKREREDSDSLFEWVKAVGSLILKRIKVLSRSMSVSAPSVFKDPDVANNCLLCMTNMSSYQQIKPKTTLFLPANRITSNVYYLRKCRKE